MVTTADSIWSILPLLDDAATVQFDEACQIPAVNLISIISKFPDASFGMMGDPNQLDPYTDKLLTDTVSQLAIGSILNDAIHPRRLPTVQMKTVYRCHPKITVILGNFFYGGRLISGI